MSKRLPRLTHLQFLLIEALTDGERAGRDLRTLLAAFGVRNSGPAFYQMMGRLEEAGLVEGWYDRKLVDGQPIKERRYRLTKAGARAGAETRAFYQERLAGGTLVRRPADG